MAQTSQPTVATEHASSGLIVLGMHRSGTSVLARLLQAAGASPGDRLIPGSRGNEDGHFEDAFAVETNDRLLAALGFRWDDVRELPHDWLQTPAAVAARSEIRDYIRSTLVRHRLWLIKDPRMCLLADLWLGALADEGVPHSVVLMGRHPLEVARSLAVRNGMASGVAMLSWLRHVLAAERASRRLPRLFTTYDELLSAPEATIERIRQLPGGEHLGRALPGGVPGDIVRPERRHHQQLRAELPPVVALAWQAQVAATDGIDAHLFDQAGDALRQSDALFAPVLQAFHHEQALLWERTAHAEAAVADIAYRERLDSQSTALDDLCKAFVAFSEGNTRALGGLSQAFSQLDGNTTLALTDLSRALSATGGNTTLALTNLSHALSTSNDNTTAALGGLSQALSTSSGNTTAALTEFSQALSALGGNTTAVLTDLSNALSRLEGSNTRALTEVLQAVGEELPRLNDALTLARETAARLEQERGSLLADARRLNSRLEKLQYDSDMLQMLSRSLSWRATRPLRVLRRLLFERSERQKLRAWCAARVGGLPFVPGASARHGRTSLQGAVEATAPASGEQLATAPGQQVLPLSVADKLQPAAADPSRPDVFVWAVIDWHFRMQRPQHLAKALAAAGHRVFYISNNMVDSTRDGFAVESLDDAARLFQVRLNVDGAPEIYHDAPSATTVAHLRASVGELMHWADSSGGLCIVQHPYWLDVARTVSGSALLYDCMDHHAGFENNAPEVIAAEHRLIKLADLLIVTSAWLDDALAPANASRALIRNATEYEHFSQRPKRVYRDPGGRRIIGYYGAIAEWFDVELVRAIAERFTDCAVLLVGSDTAGAADRLRGLENVEFTGEVPYGELPYYLYAFDVALLPFRVIELTLATNPVKVYEYLSAGKPVVAVDLPEIEQFGALVHRAATHEDFLDAVALALRESPDDPVADARRHFASVQTWERRALELDAAIADLPAPRVSVVVLTYNNLAFTQACLRSIEVESRWPQLEVIVVDNASTDGTPEYLLDWARGGANRKVILNASNLGFSAGNNVGLAAATGEYLILLNNDTYVTPNWIRTLVNHLRQNPKIGIIGPVTNNIGNEARIEIQYGNMDEMRTAAAAYTRRHLGQLMPIRTVAFFCVAMPRATYESVGPLDEVFGVGFFEDDDYCRRVEAAGLGVACAEDVFVHHHLSASFDKIKAETRQELFLRNKALYEAKWGAWTAHAYRLPASAHNERDVEVNKQGSDNG